MVCTSMKITIVYTNKETKISNIQIDRGIVENFNDPYVVSLSSRECAQ